MELKERDVLESDNRYNAIKSISLMLLALTLILISILSVFAQSQFSNEPVLIRNVDNYYVRGNREFNGTSYTTSYVLSYEQDGKIIDELEIGDLYINYDSDKSEIHIYNSKDSLLNKLINTKPRVVVYTNKSKNQAELKTVQLFNKESTN